MTLLDPPVLLRAADLVQRLVEGVDVDAVCQVRDHETIPAWGARVWRLGSGGLGRARYSDGVYLTLAGARSGGREPIAITACTRCGRIWR